MKPSRILLINILATGAIYIAGFVALGDSYTTINSSEQEIVKWLSENAMRARIYAWTGAFFSLGFAIFGEQVASLLPKPNRYIFLAGAIGCAITAQVQAWVWSITDHTSFARVVKRHIFSRAGYRDYYRLRPDRFYCTERRHEGLSWRRDRVSMGRGGCTLGA